MNTYEHVVRAVFGEPWAIREETLATIAELVRFRAEGGRLDQADITARLEAAAVHAGPRSGGRVSGSVAVVPIYGVIMQRASLMSEMSGGTSVQGITKAFRSVLGDESVGSIVLDIDSPGGQVGGIEELAAEIRASRGIKPIIAVANTTMASAAYWIGCQADEVVASPSSIVGSIGVIYTHQEVSKMAEAAGITTTVFRKPSSKAEGGQWEPLTEEAKAEISQQIDDFYGAFVNGVSKGRGVTAAAVREGYGKGRVLTAKRALDAGLVDRIDTLDGTIRRLAGGKAPATRGAVAEHDLGVDITAELEQAPAAEITDTTVEDALVKASAADPEENVEELDPLELRRLKARAHAR